MTHIVYPHTWQNVQRNQVSYLLSYRYDFPWKLPIYLPSGTYQRLEDLVKGMVTGLHSAFLNIHLKRTKKIHRIGGNECFYINPKAEHCYEFTLPPGFQVQLPKNLARALGYLSHEDRVPALYLITATTITMRRNDELVWGMLSSHSFQSMYIYSDLIESLVVGDVQANLLRTIVRNLFPPGKFSRSISLNAHYIIAFNNPRDTIGFRTLAQQAFTGKVPYVLESFQDATSKPFGYLVMDLQPRTPNIQRVRTNILFGTHSYPVIYVDKKNHKTDEPLPVDFS